MTILSATAQPLRFHARPKPAADAGTNAWRVEAVQALFDLSFADLIHRAQTVHREHFDPTEVELATLLSVKTGRCPEHCGYCPQSVHFDTGLTAGKLVAWTGARGRAARQAGRCHALLHWRGLDPREFVRTITVARITMPRARVRLSAGRQQMSLALQALCFLAGAISIFYDEKLLTTSNPDVAADRGLLAKLGLRPRHVSAE